jgi:glycosyltransferase involved in cell wall biosynthesis
MSRICVIRHGYFPDDPRVRREVGALLDEGYDVDIVCLRKAGEAAADTWRSARIHRLPVRHERRGLRRYVWEYSSFFFLALLRVTMLHAQRQFHVVQVNTLPDALVFAAVVPKLSGAKVLLDMHELTPEFAAVKFHFFGSSVLIRVTVLLERWAARFADRVIAVSPVQASILERRIEERCHVVPNVPDASILGHTPNERMAGPVPAVMTHGTLTEGYGVQLLIRALPSVLRELPVKALVVGDGEYLPELKRQAAELGVDDYVEFTGPVPFSDIGRYIASSSVGVITLLRDGYMELAVPNKLFEYVALGVPVVAPDLPGIRSYFNGDQLVYFRAGDPADLAEKVVSVLRDPRLCADIVERAGTVYEQLCWEKTSRIYLGLVAELMGQLSAKLSTSTEAPR